jgi:hypothetical protein
MSMETTAWTSMYHAMHQDGGDRRFSRATLARIVRFVQPRRRELLTFLGLSVLTAALAVATPLLAGQVMDAIIDGRPLRGGMVVVLPANGREKKA